MKKEHILMSIRIPRTMRDDLNVVADAESTSVSSILRRLVKKNLPKEIAKVSRQLYDAKKLKEASENE